jgi:hypothetical protein
MPAAATSAPTVPVRRASDWDNGTSGTLGCTVYIDTGSPAATGRGDHSCRRKLLRSAQNLRARRSLRAASGRSGRRTATLIA